MRFDVRDKHITIIGAARSGVAAAVLLKRHGARVFVSDAGVIASQIKVRLENWNIDYEEGGHSERALSAFFAVVSPGVPTEAPPVQHYLKLHKPVYSEIEVASWFTDQPIVGVTGTNGKTTVTRWLDHLWATAGKTHDTSGNIGNAFSDVLNGEPRNGDLLLEISSFQLDHIDTFHPHIALILNITPDHLDRYQNSFEKYAAAKFRICENQTAHDWFIYNQDDPVTRRFAEQLSQRADHPSLLAFSLKGEVERGAFLKNDRIMFNLENKTEELMHAEELSLRGQHNLSNGLATALAARSAEISNRYIRESLKSFEGVEHRLELVRVLDGVKYINDSKATNINSVWYALDSIKEPLVLILGGRDKGNDYSTILPLIKDKVHTLIAIGESKEKINSQLGNNVPDFLEANSMEEAVRLGRKNATKNDVVLLSPACSSFDMFDNYEHRGEVYKKAVKNL